MASGVGEGAGMRVSVRWLWGRVRMTLVGAASLALVLGAGVHATPGAADATAGPTALAFGDPVVLDHPTGALVRRER